ncbi:MAG: hypothetical protein QOD92_2729 [Acidimicrobiaceae bacterium]|jgi:hypothetical protein
MPEHDLYRLDPAEFVPARDQLAKELRAAGQREEAAAVKALRRPTVPAWALNQVSHAHPDEVQALLDAADDARTAQQAVLEGADRETLRDALNSRRAALRAVARHARDVVEQSGRSADAQEREVDAALLTIVDSPELTETLRRGELVDVRATEDASEDLSSMFSASLAAVPTKPGRSERAPKPTPPKAKLTVVRDEPDPASVARLEETREQVRVTKEEERAAAERLSAAKAALKQAERDVASADKDVDRARQAVERAERALRKLE